MTNLNIKFKTKINFANQINFKLKDIQIMNQMDALFTSNQWVV